MKQGFVLIEFIMIVAVVSVIGAISYYGIRNTNIRNRDDQRRVDLLALEKAIESSYPQEIGGVKAKDSYFVATTPMAIASLGWISPSFLESIPEDPSGKTYLYQSDDKGQSFSIFAELESPETSVAVDKSVGALPNGYNFWVNGK